jgi:hypothetical protein
MSVFGYLMLLSISRWHSRSYSQGPITHYQNFCKQQSEWVCQFHFILMFQFVKVHGSQLEIHYCLSASPISHAYHLLLAFGDGVHCHSIL